MYIQKSAVLKEIEKLIDYVSEFPSSEPEQIMMKGSSLKSLITLKETIDTLKVKEIQE